MANTIRHKRGTTTPAASALVTGELAINTATGTVFTKTDAGAVVNIGSGGGLTVADIGGGSTTAGNLILDALQNANAPTATNQFATEGDVNSAVSSYAATVDATFAKLTDIPTNSVKAWVNFNGTGTVAIRASYNVSSITDNGAADYTVNFTNAMSDANYAVSTASNGILGNNGAWIGMLYQHSSQAPTTTSVRVATLAIADFTYCSVAIFR